MNWIRASIRESGPRFRPQQVVDVVQPFGQVILLAPGAAARDLNDPSFRKAGELSAAFARLDPGALRDLPRGSRLPQVREGEVDPPLLRGQRFDVALEVFRMVVDEVEQILHELAKGASRAEPGHDGDQTRAAAGENLQ